MAVVMLWFSIEFFFNNFLAAGPARLYFFNNVKSYPDWENNLKSVIMSILSIQSHVSYGHVGNSAAVFPLQRLGFEVWPVHTVMFSNHAGYDSFKGPVLAPDDLRAVLSGMGERGCFAKCRAVLSGYLGSAALGEVVLEAVQRARAENPNTLYCCDPVMGDVGKDVYVKKTIPSFIEEKLLPEADLLTPNQFELELLSGHKVKDLNSSIAAARDLVARGVTALLVTSLERDDLPAGQIEMLAVSGDEAWLVNTPRLDFPIMPNGAGDICAALFTGHFLKNRDLKRALEQTTATVYGLFEASWQRGERELALIEAQDEIIRPSHPFDARSV
ncbi:pyridoxal kinase PdxY [Aestuariispira insulae]|uniref:pyridoxal kinase n=1 Tax=Aestuariispira insulae TaxID=1461337 RepID=A0A3D9HXY2_9PROT|nr:pyridoxal kinase PdxY [Aestuariispira insulae]RED54280.1 pyridoxal kinase [Aestuariispira insulae]